jgi:thiol-disulfide isomerase/thioredoxin
MKARSVIVAVALVAFSAAAFAADIEWMDSYDAALAKAKADKKPLLVLIHASWCQPSQKFIGETLADALIVELSAKFVCVKLDQDQNVTLCNTLNTGLITPRLKVINVETSANLAETAGFCTPDAVALAMQNGLARFEGKPVIGSEPTVKEGKIVWKGFADALKLARSDKKPVIVLFCADNWAGLAGYEKKMFTDKQVLDLAVGFVFAKVDAAKDSTIAGKFSVTKSPVLRFSDHRGNPLLPEVKDINSPAALTANMKKAVDAYKKALSQIDWVESMEEGSKLSQEKGKPLFIYIWAEDVGQCRAVEETIMNNVEVMRAAKRFICIKLNARKNTVDMDKLPAQVKGTIPGIWYIEPGTNQIKPAEDLTAEKLAMEMELIGKKYIRPGEDPADDIPMDANMQKLAQVKVTIHAKDATLEALITDIATQAGFKVKFDASIPDNIKKRSGNKDADNASAKDLLDELVVSAMGAIYKIEGDTIVIKK